MTPTSLTPEQAAHVGMSTVQVRSDTIITPLVWLSRTATALKRCRLPVVLD